MLCYLLLTDFLLQAQIPEDSCRIRYYYDELINGAHFIQKSHLRNFRLVVNKRSYKVVKYDFQVNSPGFCFPRSCGSDTLPLYAIRLAGQKAADRRRIFITGIEYVDTVTGKKFICNHPVSLEVYDRLPEKKYKYH